ncbi:helicase HerA domain-containing protein [Trujillonella humicola]|uniref:helicase HerA domain-containing protein n=1 Tax=Trujillonella humicola TaxID=3383699 RepID=UPI003905A924
MTARSLRLVAVAEPAAPLLRATAAAAAALLDLPVPARWTFAVEVGGAAPAEAHLTVRSLDDALAEQALEAAGAVLAVTTPWATWAAAPDADAGRPLPFSAALAEAPVDAASPAPGPDLLPAFWHGTTRATARTRLTLTLVTPGAGSASGQPRGRVVLSSDAPTLHAVGGTLAAGLGDDTARYAFGPLRPGEGTLPLTVPVVGRCLAAVSLVPGGWDARASVPAGELLDRLTRTAPPHTAVFGGSGLGKTTLLRAVVEHRLAAGGTAVVLDPHGDLAAQVTLDASRLGVPVQVLDFGDPDDPPRWNVMAPPEGVDPRAWVTELLAAVQAAWPGADAQWFGPVFRRAMGGLLLPLVLDPAGPWPLPSVLQMALPRNTDRDDPAVRWRDGVLSRVPADVRRDAWEAVGLMDRDREGHARTWLISKLEPLLQHPGVRAVIDHPVGTVDLAAVQAGRSLVAALPASTLGDEGATVLSLLLLRWLWGHARRGARQPVDVVLDEAHRMPAGMCAELLAEGRKFGLQLRLGTQSPAVLPGDLRTAVLTNVGTVASFRVGPLDAAHLRGRLGAPADGELAALRPHQVLVTADDGQSVVGTGPAGEPGDGAGLMRRLSRSDVDQRRRDVARTTAVRDRIAQERPADPPDLTRRPQVRRLPRPSGLVVPPPPPVRRLAD